MKYIVFLIGLLILIVLVTRVVYSKVRCLGHSSNDLFFKNNTWNNFMIAGFQFNEDHRIKYNEYKKTTIEGIRKWEKTTIWYKTDNLEGKIIEDSDSTKQEFLKSLHYSSPECINGTSHSYPFFIYFLEKEKYIYLFLNHYYCDGIILHDFMAYNIYNLKSHPTRFVKYKYIPIVSDFMLLKFLIRNMITGVLKPLKPLTHDTENSYIIKKEIQYEGKINREIAIAKVMQFVLKYLNKDSLRVGISVGFDDSGVLYNTLWFLILILFLIYACC